MFTPAPATPDLLKGGIMVLTISPVDNEIGGKMHKQYFKNSKNLRKLNFNFFRIEILGVPDNQIFLHISVPENQI